MTFDLVTIAFFSLAAALYSAVLPARWRGWALLIGSLLAIYALQPPLPIRRLDFILPTFTLFVAIAGWWLTRDPASQAENRREDRITFGLVAVVVLGVSATRYLTPALRLTTRPPDPFSVALALAAALLVGGGIYKLLQRRGSGAPVIAGMLAVVALFAIVKTEPLAVILSRWLRSSTGQETDLASFADIAGWVGFSYVAFRIIHTLRDRQTGKLPALSLREYVTYVVFFPAYIAGPIDRAERFVKDLRALPDMRGLAAPRFTEGLARICVGIFKKFVIADSLALGLSLNATNAAQAESTLGLWLLLYGYALRLFFDFSGYSDIAIGIGILFGIKLPENFDRPYLKHDIASFWQSWHITLSSWARFYVFSPLSRALLMRQPKPSPVVVVLSTQLATMIVIGLWHGVTINFVMWGIWHGLGLFAHKQWSDRTRKWYISLKDKPAQKRAWTVAGWFITFHFVVLGWVWFALPDFDQSVRVFGGLLGLNL